MNANSRSTSATVISPDWWASSTSQVSVASRSTFPDEQAPSATARTTATTVLRMRRL